MKENICKCTNCDSLLYDENPQTDAVQFDTTNIGVQILPMEQLNDDGETFWGCGNCQSDSYLMDIHSQEELDKFIEEQKQ